MIKLKEFLQRRRRPLLWTAGLLCLYALLGFLFLPWFAERQLLATLQQRLGANASVEAIRFNPFTFTASVDQLDVQAADSSPLLSLQRLYLNLEPLRLLLLKVRIGEITLDTLQLHYNRYSDTDDTLTRLTQQWTATAAPQSAEEIAEEEAQELAAAANTTTETGANADETDDLFPLEVGRFQYLNGSIHYRDEVPETDFATTLGPLNVDVANISTLDTEEKGSKAVVLQIEQDATLTWTSSFDVTPLQFTGQLALDNFSLTTPYRYFQDSLPFVLRNGRVAAQFDYRFSLDEATGPHLELSNVGVQVSALDAVENGSDLAFLAGGTLALENGGFVYPDMRAQAAALRIDGLNLALLRDAEGDINLQRMLDGFASDTTTPADAAETPLQLSLDEFALTNMTVNFTDDTTQTPATFNLQAQLNVQDFTLAPDTALPINAGLTLASGGALTAEGTLQLFPALDVAATLELADLSLPPMQPYLDELAQITLESGNLGFSARLRSNSSETLAWQGDVTLDQLQLADQQRAETLLSMEALRATDVDFALTANRLDISELILDALYSRIFIDENGVTNIREAFIPATPSEDAATAAEPEAAAAAGGSDDALAISLGRMQINEASSDFTDLSLPIVFDTKMHALNGEVSGFSSTSSQAMKVGMEGQVDEYGLVEITGNLTPLDYVRQTTIEMAFTNLDLPAMTPYVIKYAGREIAEGKVDVALAYVIDDSALQASNSVIIRDMRLGPRVEYPGAMDLPLDLAVALLKNSEGIIDLEVPVTGNVNDPQFSLGPVIRQAVFNVIVNIVTSPFRLLGSLIGGGEEEIDSIRFRPGRSDLAPPEQEKLQKLLEALAQRPQLALMIPAPFETTADTQALQASTVDARIEEQLALDESDEPLPERRFAVLEMLYMTAMLTPTLEELRMQFTTVPAAAADTGDDEDAEPVFDTLAYSDDLRQRLINAEPVTETMLQTLARERQTAVSSYLMTNGGIGAERLQQQDAEAAALEDDWISAAFDVGVIE